MLAFTSPKFKHLFSQNIPRSRKENKFIRSVLCFEKYFVVTDLPCTTMMNNIYGIEKRERKKKNKTQIYVVQQCAYVHKSAVIFNND
jgi:hypothetical protein